MESGNKYFLKIICVEIFLLTFLFSFSNAQVKPPAVNDNVIEEQIENVAANATENTDFTEIAEKLEYYSEHPLNINKATQEEMEQSGLFSSTAVKTIISHRTSTGDIMAFEELQTLDGFGKEFILKILPYISITDFQLELKNSLKNIFRYGHHRFIVRTQQYVEKSAGYLKTVTPGATYSGYVGSPLKLYTNYRFQYKNNFSFNVTAEKDAGEQFFDSTQKNGFDFYSAHLAFRNVGFIKTLVIGDYELNYGQGLTLWTGLAFSKTPEVLLVKKYGEGIRPYYSVNEYTFKRGAAVSVGNDNWKLDMFYSNKKIDANIVLADTVSQQIEIVSSFEQTGYHRTMAELADKNSIREKLFGGHGTFTNKNFRIGVTSFHSEYSASLVKTLSVYNQFDFGGKQITKTGIDYSWLVQNINFFGEASRSDNGGIAYINGAVMGLGSNIAFSVVNRNYQRNFLPLFSNGFGESSGSHNERGTYFGITTKPVSAFTLSAYYDVFTFPWLRYQVNAPSRGYEYLCQLTYTPNKQTEIYFRARQSVKQENSNDPTVLQDYLVNTTQSNYRVNVAYKISKTITLRSRVETVNIKTENATPENGYLFFQDISINPFGFPISANVRYALFDTKSFNSRIYTFENDVLYSYSIPFFYNRGSRYYITLHYNVAKNIDVWLRYAQTIYSNQNTVGSGLDQIEGNHRSEVKAQIRLQF